MEGKVFFNHLKNEKEETAHRTNVKYFFFPTSFYLHNRKFRSLFFGILAVPVLAGHDTAHAGEFAREAAEAVLGQLPPAEHRSGGGW